MIPTATINRRTETGHRLLVAERHGDGRRGFQPTDHGTRDDPRRGATHETVCHTARYRRINLE
jgi:hypothetical protein